MMPLPTHAFQGSFLTFCALLQLRQEVFWHFTTALVGIKQNGTFSSPLFHWSWRSDFNGLSGGVSTTYNTYPTDPGSGTGAVTITDINGTPQMTPNVTCAAEPTTLWPPNGKPVVVTVSGTVTPGTQPIPSSGSTYAVVDEYSKIQSSGSITVGAGGGYSFGVTLLARRNGNDMDGRMYSIVVDARDSIGNVGTCSLVVTVPHDQGH
jgi:hypothetical protein